MSDSLRPHGLQHPGFPIHYQLLELAKTHVHQVIYSSTHLLEILECLVKHQGEQVRHGPVLRVHSLLKKAEIKQITQNDYVFIIMIK